MKTRHTHASTCLFDLVQGQWPKVIVVLPDFIVIVITVIILTDHQWSRNISSDCEKCIEKLQLHRV